MYIALYRKYRPKTFEDICGQEQITTTLKNEILMQKLSHAYLFCGTRGTGKTSMAKLLAKALNCENPDGINPCELCNSCVSINDGVSLDVFEIDAASNRGIDDIRNLRESVRFAPAGKYKVYIIDEVHMLTTEAFNALLKTLEEPPAYVIFILATTEPHKLLPTILSRCQRFDFKRIGISDIVARLRSICIAEDISINDECLELIARNSDGAMRDAVSTLDQCAVFCGNDVSYENVIDILGIAGDKMVFDIAQAMGDRDFKVAITLVDGAVNGGRDIVQFVRDMMVHYRNLLMVKLVDSPDDMISLSKDGIRLLMEQSKIYSTEGIIFSINVLANAEYTMKTTTMPRIILEIAVAKICKPENNISSDAMAARLSRLENQPMARVSPSDNVSSDTYTKVNQTIKIKEPIIAKDIKQNWGEFLIFLKERKRLKLSTFMRMVKPILKEDGCLILSYAIEDRFTMEAVEKPSNKEELQALASEFFKKDIKIKAVLEGEITNSNMTKKKDEVENLIGIFGKDMIEIIE